MTVDPATMSPEWWVDRMYASLMDRNADSEMFEAYYRGDHPLPWLSREAAEEFRKILSMARSNYMGLVIDATAERLMVEGFRLASDQEHVDEDTWRIWQANDLDANSDLALLEALITGQSYLLVEPNRDDPSTPNVWVEHPTQAIVEYQPGMGRRERAAGLKVWDDDWTDYTFATLYLPDAVYKFQTPRRKYGEAPLSTVWTPREVTGESWGGPNPLGEVPLVELANNPRLLSGGVSEIADVIDIQDRVNKTIADRLVTQDYGAFPQKWLSGWPTSDAEGNPVPEIHGGRHRVVTTDVPDARFGQWDAAPLDPYLNAKREDVKDIASRTRTPAQYLLGEMSHVNGETLKASESGLISKVRQRQRFYGEAIEEAMGLARRAAGLPDAGDEGMETIWRDPQYRTEGEKVDALVKMSTLGVPNEALWEKWGATPAERARWSEMAQAAKVDPTLQHLADSLAGGPASAPVAPVAPPPGNPVPPGL